MAGATVGDAIQPIPQVPLVIAVTETEPRPSSRALVASFLFTDLVGFSIGTAAEQYAAKATLSAILRSNLAALRDVDYRIKDTGDGALIAFTSNPEHALYMALAIAEDFGRAASTAGFPSNSLRTGLHLGSVKEAIDLEARPNFIGDGINAAKRIMDFAAPGQITASRAFFDAVASLDSAYAALFRHVGAADDKHGRAHELYAVSPSATVLQELKLDLAAAARESAESAAKSAAMTEVKHESQRVATTASQANSSHADAARKWLLPAGAVIALGVASVLVATKLLGPGTPSIPKLTTESVLVPSASKQAAAPPTSAEETRVDSPPSPALPPKPEVTTPAPAARVEEGAATSDSTRPPSVPAAAAAKTNAKIKPRIDAAPTVPITSNAVPDRTSPRCSRIMEKATLGEALSTEEKRELATSCR